MTSYTPNLRLRIEDGITSDALYNLQRIDELGSLLQLSTASNVELTSAEDIIIQPNNPASGGNGVGGYVSIGTSIQPIDLLDVYAYKISFHRLQTLDLGTATLVGSYTIPWERIDTSSIDFATVAGLEVAIEDSPAVQAASAHVESKSNPHSTTASQVGAYSISETDALLAAKANLAIVESHINASSGVHGLSGSVVGTSDAQTLINKSIDADTNTIRNISNTEVAIDAAIAGSKIDANFGSQVVRSSAGVRLDGATSYVTIVASSANQSGPLTFKLPATYGQNGQVLATDGQGNLSWQNATGAAISQKVFYWYPEDGTEFTIVHGFNNSNLDITVRDSEDNEIIYIPDVNFLDNNTLLMVSSEAPSVAWQITIQGVVL